MSTRIASLFYTYDRLKARAAPIAEKVAAFGRGAAGSRRSANGVAHSTPLPVADDSSDFTEQLHAEVLGHSAVNHPLLARLVHVPFVRDDYRIFGLQYRVVIDTPAACLERLLQSAPDQATKSRIANALVAEYRSDVHSAYRDFLQATGISEDEEVDTPLHGAATKFVQEHIRICRDEPFAVALGAVGAGHIWAVPKMFEQVLSGLERTGLAPSAIRYFAEQAARCSNEASWVDEAIMEHSASTEARGQIHAGAMRSLAAWVHLWSGIQDKMVRWRQPRNVHLRTQGGRDGYDPAREVTLRQWRDERNEVSRASKRISNGDVA